ncbi:hypothetical protein BJ912DRAFT_928931 [Pholiota molesta]|nr:hypothetical protein BJ912DRAFT_928931 [Pholiota molesta]
MDSILIGLRDGDDHLNVRKLNRIALSELAPCLPTRFDTGDRFLWESHDISRVMTWDVLNHCKEDYHLLFSFDPCVHATLYAVTRYMTLAYVLAKTLYLKRALNKSSPQAIQIPHCNMLGSAIAAFYMLAVSGTLLQASIRLWKLLDRKKNVLVSLGALWIVAVGGSVTYAVGSSPDAAAADACVDQIKGEYVALAFIVLFVYHACLLVAVGLAIQQNVFADRTRLSLPERLASLLWFYGTSVGHHAASLRLMLVPVYLVSTNILIGRVFRSSTLALLLQAPHAPPPSTAPPGLKLNLSTGGCTSRSGRRAAPLGTRGRTAVRGRRADKPGVKISMDGGGERGAAEGTGARSAGLPGGGGGAAGD